MCSKQMFAGVPGFAALLVLLSNFIFFVLVDVPNTLNITFNTHYSPLQYQNAANALFVNSLYVNTQ